jgi:hypothetical protein
MHPNRIAGACFFLAALTLCRAAAAPPEVTDADLLDRTEAQACAYAVGEIVQTPPTAEFPNGRAMVADTSRSGNLCSVAATGMGLVCYAILAKRSGSTDAWTVSADDARQHANAVLDAVLEMQSSPTRSFAGVPYHFVVPDAGGGFMRAPGSEVSSVDGALLVAGALAAGQAFGGEVREKALRIAANVQWPFFLISTASGRRFSMAWRPESGDGYTVPTQGGYLTTSNWDRPTDEVLVIAILAMGNTPANPNVLAALYSWPRVARAYHGGNGETFSVVNSYFGSLFSYTQLHALVPFDLLGPDHPADVRATVAPVDWWANSVAAARASRQFSADHAPGQNPPDAFATHAAFGPDSWGLTAAYDPANLSNYLGSLGAPPREANGGAPEPQGVIAPYGAISALRLLQTAPDEAPADNPAFRALRNYYDTRYDSLWGAYGPKDAFNDAGQVANIYVGIDTGPEAMGIEDYRSGDTHRWFASSPPVADGLAVIFHKGLSPGDPDLDGAVTFSDAVLALRVAGGLDAPRPSARYNADLNGDGSVTLEDATMILRLTAS